MMGEQEELGKRLEFLKQFMRPTRLSGRCIASHRLPLNGIFVGMVNSENDLVGFQWLTPQELSELY